jgi:hypothetical protein
MPVNEIPVVVVPLADLQRMIERTIEAKLRQEPKEEYITQADACRLFRISEKTLKKYRESGGITTKMIGRKVLFLRHDIETACVIRNPETR